MKKLTALVVLIFVFAMPLLMLFAERSAQKEAERPATVHYVVPASSEAPRRAESAPAAPQLTTAEYIASINAGYEQIWADEQSRAPKSDAPDIPEARYALSDDERREIERMVASEGGYCEYEFQALVAECILNGCEADGLRPLELFERGDFWLTHNVEPTETTKQAVADVFDRGIFPTAEKVRYYYNPNYCKSEMHESFCYVLTCCDCRFFKDWE